MPVRPALPAGTRVAAVAAGEGYSLAVTSDGRALAWGNDDYGQLGNGGAANDSMTVDLPPGTRVTAVSAGGTEALAVAVHRHWQPVARGAD